MEKTDHPYHFPKNVKELQESWKTYWIKIGILQMAVNMYLTECLLTDSLILVNNSFQVLKYSRDGKFLGKISNYGRGPGENLGIGSISVLQNRDILAIQTYKKILLYSLDGKLIESIRTPTFTSTLFTADDRFIAYNNGGLGNELYTFLLTNRKLDTISYVINPLKWRDDVPNSFMIEYPFFDPFYQNLDKHYIKSVHNDTVYFVLENKIIPDYLIDLGKYKLPDEWNPEKIVLKEPEKMNQLFKVEEQCYYCNALESGDRLFLTLVNFHSHKTKNIMFEKRSPNKGYMLINQDKEPCTFLNDIDRGMDFWPEGKIDDKHLFMTLKVTDLKKKLDQINESHEDKTPEQEKLIKLITDLDISANPVLMIVTLK